MSDVEKQSKIMIERVAAALTNNPDVSIQGFGKEIITFVTTVTEEFVKTRQELSDLKTRMYRELTLHGRISKDVSEKPACVESADVPTSSQTSGAIHVC